MILRTPRRKLSAILSDAPSVPQRYPGPGHYALAFALLLLLLGCLDTAQRKGQSSPEAFVPAGTNSDVSARSAPQALAKTATERWWEREIAISFHGPPYYRSDLPELTERAYRWMKEADFNLVLGANEVDNLIKNRQLLKFSAKYGLKAIVIDKAIYQRQNLSEATIDSVLNLYYEQLDEASLKALEGFFIWDEPNYDDLGTLQRQGQKIVDYDSSLIAYVNLYPNYVSPKRLAGNSYSQYVQTYLELLKPKVLCFDFYPFLENEEYFGSGYFENWELMRNLSQKTATPLWVFVQLTPHKATPTAKVAFRNTTEPELRVQVYIALAFGARGILYYTFQGYHNRSYYDAIISSDGWQRLSHYYMVQRINGEIRKLENRLLGLRSEGVYYTPRGSGNRNPFRNSPIIQGVSDPEILVGEFSDSNEQRYILTVNTNYRQAKDYGKISFRKDLKNVYMINKNTGEEQPVPSADKEFWVSLFAGDGMLFRVVF